MYSKKLVGESKGTKGTASIGDDFELGMEGDFVVCEHLEEFGGEQSPTRIKAPPQKRRAVIRVESVETQDYVSEPQGLEGIVVVEERGAVHTINLCKQCFIEVRMKRGERTVTGSRCRDDRAEGFSRKAVGGLQHGTNCAKTVEEISASRKAWDRSVLADAEKVRRERRFWQQESPCK